MVEAGSFYQALAVFLFSNAVFKQMLARFFLPIELVSGFRESTADDAVTAAPHFASFHIASRLGRMIGLIIFLGSFLLMLMVDVVF